MSPARDLCVLCVQAAFLHFNMNVDAPPKKPAGSRHGREGEFAGEKTPFEIVLFPCKSDVFSSPNFPIEGFNTSQLCSSFPAKTSASRNPLDLTLEEVQQAGWKFPRIPNGDLEARISRLIAGPPKRKAQRCVLNIPTGEMEKWTSVEILSTSRIFGEFGVFCLEKMDGFSPTPRVF